MRIQSSSENVDVINQLWALEAMQEKMVTAEEVVWLQ